MSQIRFRQIARLEKRALPYIKQREGIAEQLRKLRSGAVAHAAVVAFLTRYGNPQMSEPLSEACRRVTASEAWKSCRARFPDYKKYRDGEENPFDPYNRDRVSLIGDPLRHVLISTLPGTDEKDKLNRALQAVPPWLIWFTFADYTANLLGLALPDLSTVAGFERPKDIFHGWWGLPESAFECRRWPHGTNQETEPLVRTDLSLLELKKGQDPAMTNRERKRALTNSARSNPSQPIEWPGLLSEEWLQLDFGTQLSLLRKAGHFGGDRTRHPEFCDINVSGINADGSRGLY